MSKMTKTKLYTRPSHCPYAYLFQLQMVLCQCKNNMLYECKSKLAIMLVNHLLPEKTVFNYKEVRLKDTNIFLYWLIFNSKVVLGNKNKSVYSSS